MSTPILQRPKRWRRFVLIGAGVLLILYIGSYLRFRLHHDIIHTRSFAGAETYHGVRPGSPHGPSIFAAALISDQLDQLPVIGAAIERRQNFLLTMLRLAREREELRVVADQIGTPTWVQTLSAFTKAAVTDDGKLTIGDGIYHLSATGRISWHGFAEAILAAVDDPLRKAKRVVPIATQDFPTPAKRPAFSVLSNQKIEFATKMRVPDWQEQLAACGASLAASLETPGAVR